MVHWVERVWSTVLQATWQNVLVMALLVALAVPSFFAWKFLTDPGFRHEFISSVKIVDYKVPCTVAQTSLPGDSYRFLVATVFEIRGRMEYAIATRSPGLLSDGEVSTACAIVHDMANQVRGTLTRNVERASEGK